jgi:hypothetical protein
MHPVSEKVPGGNQEGVPGASEVRHPGVGISGVVDAYPQPGVWHGRAGA